MVAILDNSQLLLSTVQYKESDFDLEFICTSVCSLFLRVGWLIMNVPRNEKYADRQIAEVESLIYKGIIMKRLKYVWYVCRNLSLSRDSISPAYVAWQAGTTNRYSIFKLLRSPGIDSKE